MNILELSKKEQDYLVNTRRYLHQHPELSMFEKETSAFVQKELTALCIPFEMVDEYGVLAKIEGQNTDKMVALRGDMDALPIQEENDHLTYKSMVPGVMHACGHDAHTAMLLGAVRVLNQIKSELKGTVLFCFQQAEETAYGAKKQVEAIASYPVKSCFGIHVEPAAKSGIVEISAGAVMAASDTFTVIVQGRGGHGSRPDLSIDPISACATMVLEIARAKAQEMDPFEASTISVCSFQSGDCSNVIPDTGCFIGSIRSLSKESRKKGIDIVNRVCNGVAIAHGVTVTIEYTEPTQIVYNDEKCTELFKQSAAKIVSVENIKKSNISLGAEDFAEFSDCYPSVFAMLGTGNEELQTEFTHHHPKFNLDDTTLHIGTALYAQYAVDFLENNERTK